MPPKVSFTPAQVVDAAFALVRVQGIGALSARAVAQSLGCSTQPIYRAFGSMQRLQQAVFERAADVAKQFMLGERDAPPFLAVGYGNLRFAQQEPHLYALITRSDHVVRDLVNGAEPPAFVLEQMRKLPALAVMSDSQLRRIHTLLWFFSLGIASVFGVDTGQDPLPMAREYLAMAGVAVIQSEQRQGTS